MEIQNASKIWAAATLDAGSQFTFRQQNSGMCSMIKVRRYDKWVIDEFQKHFGGSVSQMKSGSWEWVLQGMAVTDFLKELMPYLRTKTPHAMILMEFNTYLRYRTETGNKRKRLTREDFEYRNGIIARIRLLSKTNKP